MREESANLTVRDFFKDNFTRNELESLMSATGLTVTDLLSTRSTPYRELDLGDKDLSDDEIISLMLHEPRLLKRPIVVSGSQAVVGYKAEALRELVKLDSKR